jgi:hypothetical protein
LKYKDRYKNAYANLCEFRNSISEPSSEIRKTRLYR